MVPDYISEKKMLELKVDSNGEGHCYTCMGCRSFLTPYVDENGKAKYYGRFNQGVVTINLVDVALSSGRDMDKIKALNLTLVDSDHVSVPGIKELPLTLECKVLYKQKQDLSAIPEALIQRYYPADDAGFRDNHIAYYGEILNAYLITE